MLGSITYPQPLEINDAGVILNGFTYTASYKGISVEYRMAYYNGAWRGAISIHMKNCGMACPLWIRDVGFYSAEDCIDYWCERVNNFTKVTFPKPKFKDFK